MVESDSGGVLALQKSFEVMKMGEPLLISKRDSAIALGISLRMVEILIAARELKSVRVGRRRLIPRCELEKFVKRDHVIQKDTASGQD